MEIAQNSYNPRRKPLQITIISPSEINIDLLSTFKLLFML